MGELLSEFAHFSIPSIKKAASWVAIISFLLSFISCSARAEAPSQTERELLLDAICLVESNGNANAVGDKGKSRGAYQIQEAAWLDSGVVWDYLPNVWDKNKSRIVCQRYCEKYAGKNGSLESWARVWNGGPKGAARKATKAYWEKVKNKMEELKKRDKKS